MYTLDQILQVAKRIQPQLSTGLDAETADSLDRQLQTLIVQAEAGQAVENEILGLFASHDPLREAAQVLLGDQAPDDVRLYQPFAGTGAAREYPRFQCPTCHYVWSQLRPTDPIPPCASDANHPALQPL
jgi:hypothetical protein